MDDVDQQYVDGLKQKLYDINDMAQGKIEEASSRQKRGYYIRKHTSLVVMFLYMSLVFEDMECHQNYRVHSLVCSKF